MADILEFPESLRLNHNLNGCKNDLKELLETQGVLLEQLDILQTRIEQKEEEYDLAFVKYAKARGSIENVEVGYFEYLSGAVAVSVETGEIHYVKPEDKADFDPEPSGAA